MSSSTNNFQNDAAARAADMEAQRQAAAAVERARREKMAARDTERRANMDALSQSQGGDTAHFARVAASDYTHNSTRAIVGPDGQPFLEPRWQPDEETNNCTKCHKEFDFFWNRKHHCRHCGMIFCDSCSRDQALLPVAFNKTDPQRVCGACYATLEPHQSQLSELIANAEKQNDVDLSSGSLMRYCNMPFSLTLGSEIRKASYSLHNMFESEWLEDKDIPAQLLANAKGIAFLTVAKAGIVLAPKIGTGLVVSKLPNGTWSAPSAIATMGVSWGFLAGIDVTDFVIILNTTDAVKSFSGIGNVQIGAGVDVAIGPVGRGMGGGLGISESAALNPALMYGNSKGAFVGVSLDGSLIMTRPDVNFKFYGRQYDPLEILFGNVPAPNAAEPLYTAIARHLKQPGHGASDNEDGAASDSRAGARPAAAAAPPRGSGSSGNGNGNGAGVGGIQQRSWQGMQQQQYDNSFFSEDRDNVHTHASTNL